MELVRIIFLILGALVGLALLLAFLLGAVVTVAEIFAKQATTKEHAERYRHRLSQSLKPWQAFLIGGWYVFHLIGAVLFAYSLLESSTPESGATQLNDVPGITGTQPPTQAALKDKDFFFDRLLLTRRSPIAFTMALCFACGCVGATLYGILWLSRRQVELQNQWLLRRHVLLPVLGGFLGAISYLFVKAGLITMQAGNAGEATGFSTEADRLNFGFYCIAFLAGFASRELTAKLTQIAENVFTKVQED